jgi:TonB family protein
MSHIYKFIFVLLAVSSTLLSKQTMAQDIQILAQEKPFYPIKASYEQVTGEVKVAIVFNQQGDVIDIDILGGKSVNTFEESVLFTVANWRTQSFSHQEFYRIERTFYFGASQQKSNNTDAGSAANQVTTATADTFKQNIKKQKRLYKGYRQYIKRKHGSNGR